MMRERRRDTTVPQWTSLAAEIVFCASFGVVYVIGLDGGLEQWTGKSFLLFLGWKAKAALFMLAFVVWCLMLGGWSVINIIERTYWEPYAIIVLWLSAVLLGGIGYAFLCAWHLER